MLLACELHAWGGEKACARPGNVHHVVIYVSGRNFASALGCAQAETVTLQVPGQKLRQETDLSLPGCQARTDMYLKSIVSWSSLH